MHGTYNTPAFTLIELLLALLVVGIIGSMMIPNLGARKPRQEREQFLSELNTLVGLAWRQAMVTGKPTKVVFDFKKNKKTVSVEQVTGQKDRDGNPVSAPIKVGNAIMRFPDRYLIKNFLIERFDEMKRYGGGPRDFSTWFFIMPGGLTQEVIINLEDTKDKKAGKPYPVGLVLNPFTAQFKIYDEFQK